MINDIYLEAMDKLENEVLNMSNLKFNILDKDEFKLYEDMSVDIFRKYYNILADSKEEMEFNSRFKYRPEYVAYMIYGTASYDYLILHANELTSKKKFVADSFIGGKFLYYSKEAINIIVDEMRNYIRKDTEPVTTENYLLYAI